jgi:putative toxin-antitoxin system antitoxin component (TIGR02293 family)
MPRNKPTPKISKLFASHGSAPEVFAHLTVLLGLQNIQSERDLARVVESGLTTRSVDVLVKHGLKEQFVFDLVIPRRTLGRRVSRKERLSKDESDKLVRVGRVIALAEQTFGEKRRAWAWLEDQQQFDGTSPLEMCSTAQGSRLVESRLYQLYFGIFA